MKNKEKGTMRIRKWLCIIISIVLLLILLVPIPSFADDGGTVRYDAMIYTVTIFHSMREEDGYDGFLVGTRIRIFNRVVFDNTRFERCEVQ